MSLSEPLQAIAEALTDEHRRVLPAESGRWRVLFGGWQRPLLVPVRAYRAQERCLRYFVPRPLQAMYGRLLLALNRLAPRAGVLPELRLRDSQAADAEARLLPAEASGAKVSDAAIQIGASGPAQKAAILLVAESGDGVALAKMAMSPEADACVAAEAGWLAELESVTDLRGRVPRLLGKGRALNGRRYMVESLAPGSAATNSFTFAHLDFLRTLGRSRLKTRRFQSSACFARMRAALDEMRPQLSPAEMRILEGTLKDCCDRLGSWIGPFVFSQGDFECSNIRLDESGIFVFDWESARLEGNAMGDVLHFLLAPAAASRRGISTRAALRSVRQAAGMVRQLYPEWKWRPRILSGLAMAHVLESVLQMARSRRELDLRQPVMRNYWRLLETRPAWAAA